MIEDLCLLLFALIVVGIGLLLLVFMVELILGSARGLMLLLAATLNLMVCLALSIGLTGPPVLTLRIALVSALRLVDTLALLAEVGLLLAGLELLLAWPLGRGLVDSVSGFNEGSLEVCN